MLALFVPDVAVPIFRSLARPAGIRKTNPAAIGKARARVVGSLDIANELPAACRWFPLSHHYSLFLVICLWNVCNDWAWVKINQHPA